MTAKNTVHGQKNGPKILILHWIHLQYCVDRFWTFFLFLCYLSTNIHSGNQCLMHNGCVIMVTPISGSMVEVAMTGTALPVLLTISPSYKFNFGECPVGEHADVLCTIRNESNVLPAIFQFRKIAHFLTHPPNGKIPPSQSQDVIFSFSPNQIGRSRSEIYHLISVYSEINIIQ